MCVKLLHKTKSTHELILGNSKLADCSFFKGNIRVVINNFIFFLLTEECKKEDIVFSLLRFLVTELVHVAHMTANLFGIHRVYFCGNFVNHEITRRDITSVFAVRNTFDMSTVSCFWSDRALHCGSQN